MPDIDISTVAGLRDALAFPAATPMEIFIDGKPAARCVFVHDAGGVQLYFASAGPFTVTEVTVDTLNAIGTAPAT